MYSSEKALKKLGMVRTCVNTNTLTDLSSKNVKEILRNEFNFTDRLKSNVIVKTKDIEYRKVINAPVFIKIFKYNNKIVYEMTV